MDNFGGFDSWMRANNCNERTIDDRHRVLTGFARTHPTFPQVKPAEITAWLGRQGYSQWTRGAYYGHLRSYFTFALEVDLIGVDPMARMRRPRSGKSVPRPLTSTQVTTVMAAAKPTVAAWLTLGLYAGLRAHEIAKIRGEDVGVDQLWVLGKGGEGVYLPTHPAIWALAAVMPAADWWFPSSASSLGHVRSTSVSTMTSRLFAVCGIEGSIHRCRHTYATRLLRAGVNVRVVQELMRHKSLASTMIYTAVDESERIAAINQLAA